MGENICKWYDKWLKSNIHKQVKQLNIKKTQLKNGQKIGIDSFPKEEIQMASGHLKKCPTLLVIR